MDRFDYRTGADVVHQKQRRLTRGRVVHESARTLWINSAHRCSSVHESMTRLTNAIHRTSGQHAEMGESRQNRDSEDLEKVLAWFKDNNPFDLEYTALRSLSSGVTATVQDNINCDEAEIIGETIQIKIDEMNSGVSIKRNDRVRTLICLQKSVKIADETPIHIKPSVLFGRLTLLVRNQDERSHYFEYPLIPEPAPLFLDGKMRKANKTSLRNHYLKVEESIPNPCAKYCVIDGGDLIHQTSWAQINSYKEIADGYARYVKSNFRNEHIIVVFDEYSHQDSTKNDAHLRRDSGKQSSNITITDENMKVSCNKQDFLNNCYNKLQLIDLLAKTLANAGIKVIKSHGDADVMTCKTALNIVRGKQR